METKRSATSTTSLLLAGALLIIPTMSESETLIPDKGVYDEAIAKQAWSTRDTYSPYAKQAYATQVFWGDTHLHTALSVDATIFGATLGVEDAYRFARGEEVRASSGQRIKLSRPLDFLVVADHAEALGTMDEMLKGNPEMMKDPTLKRWRDLFNSGPAGAQEAYTEMNAASTEGTAPEALKDPKLFRTIWDNYIKTGDRFNEPGRFTALLGYEYTSNYKTNNLHRVVIYRDSGERVRQNLPFSALDSENPEELWKSLQAYETETGGQVLAIPHNGNMSGGMMFALSTFAGEPLTEAWAKERARWEPLYEITQMKGDGEAHPMLSPNDEFADYETWDKMTIGGLPNSPKNYPFEYARSALKNGLALEAKLGTNPFKFGLIGSTDSHTALPAVEEDNFFGKHSGVEPSAKRMMSPVAKVRDQVVLGWEMSASGYAGVWATENTREALWDALKRKEVYATTGPRIIVRFWRLGLRRAGCPHPPTGACELRQGCADGGRFT